MVRAAPWWTPARLLLLMAALLMVLALSILWTLLLRRRVAAQTMVIREKIAHETIWQERSRIARDIHDDVGASLTRIHLLGERGQRLASRPDEAGAQFSRIVQQSRDAVRALDGIVWAVNPKNDPLSHTILYLCQTAQDLSREAGLRCRLDIPDVLPEIALPAKLRHQLLLAAKEAIHNAIKHSAAQEIRLHLAIDPAQLRLEITDDGKGFDPAAASEVRTGLDSMRRRMEDAGCGFQLASLAGGGTTVTFLIPTHGSNSL
jgi:signal transduction histidine kinase